jgi:hypothetical protein
MKLLQDFVKHPVCIRKLFNFMRQLQNDLPFFKLVDDLTFFKLEDNLLFLKLEDDLKFSNSQIGRCPPFSNWKRILHF